MDQDATWYGGRPRPRRQCVRWGPSSPPTERGTAPPLFGPCLLRRNGRPSQLLPSSCSIQPQGRNIRRGDSTGHLMMMSDVVSQTNKLWAESRAFSSTSVCCDVSGHRARWSVAPWSTRSGLPVASEQSISVGV